MMIRPMLALAPMLLAAAPAMAQVNQPSPPPSGALYGGQPPLAGPVPAGLPREAWLDECARRLSTHGVDTASIAPSCQSWWAFYQGGGAPDPTYGYTVPITITETREVIRETTIESAPIRKRMVQRDKNVRLK